MDTSLPAELARLRRLEASIEFDKDGDGFICKEALNGLRQTQTVPCGSSGLSALCFVRDGSTDWLITGDRSYATQELLQHGAKNICEVDLAEVVRRQYGDLAMLSTFS